MATPALDNRLWCRQLYFVTWSFMRSHDGVAVRFVDMASGDEGCQGLF